MNLFKNKTQKHLQIFRADCLGVLFMDIYVFSKKFLLSKFSNRRRFDDLFLV
jgi:hypothetical protein